ncbi:hypothetical protein HK102_000538 [Quaeritorhiza haematococci]|nr:hypothetical protein HK102_000538 [Quaeritorhiza haematococci]
MQAGLQSLYTCLEECNSLLSHFQKKNQNLARRLWDAGSDEEDFTFINERLHHCITELQLRIQVDQLFEARRDDADFRKDIEELKGNHKELLRLLGTVTEEKFKQFNNRLLQQQQQRSTRSFMASSVADIIIKEEDIVCHSDRILGRGGFGVVYTGSFRNKKVAIKKLRCDNLSQRARKELMDEASRMRRLAHPRIVILLGVLEDSVGRTPGLVMEYMDHGSLYTRINSLEPALPWKDRISIARDVASGMAYLHRVGLIHRDLKSQNVLLDSYNRAKITDFGMSMVRTESRSYIQVSEAAGSVYWMAPECFGLQPRVSNQSDVYAFGIILWELAAWSVPYYGIADARIESGVQRGDRMEIPDSTPDDVKQLIERAWHQQPQQRPSFVDILKMVDGISHADFPIIKESSNVVSSTASPLASKNVRRQAASPIDSAYNTLPSSPTQSQLKSVNSPSEGGVLKFKGLIRKGFQNFFQQQSTDESTPAGTGCLESAVNDSIDEHFGKVEEIGQYVYKGETALMTAAAKNNVEICKWLVKNGADVNAKINDGTTPLHSAAMNNATNACNFLLKNGADVNAEMNDGYTPLKLAQKYSNDAAVSVLRRYGGREY